VRNQKQAFGRNVCLRALTSVPIEYVKSPILDWHLKSRTINPVVRRLTIVACQRELQVQMVGSKIKPSMFQRVSENHSLSVASPPSTVVTKTCIVPLRFCEGRMLYQPKQSHPRLQKSCRRAGDECRRDYANRDLPWVRDHCISEQFFPVSSLEFREPHATQSGNSDRDLSS
jgi:hypothetical protein